MQSHEVVLWSSEVMTDDSTACSTLHCNLISHLLILPANLAIAAQHVITLAELTEHVLMKPLP